MEQKIDTLWENYDNAIESGNTSLAEEIASQVFVILSSMPENKIYLETVQ